MNLKNMLGAASLNKEEEKSFIPMVTLWGENLNRKNVLSEYPRPQMRRKNYVMLNGIWEYRILTGKEGENAEAGKEFVPDGQILVPFSPESDLSGVKRQLQPGEQLWYQRRVALGHSAGPENGGRCILHFEAVDYEAEVYVNGKPVVKHSGGYLPFEADITDVFSLHGAKAGLDTREAGNDNGRNKSRKKESQTESFLLQVCVRDDSDASYHSRGKQKRKRGGIFYTAQSGIWQSVWYEWVPDDYIKKLEITPDYDRRQIEIRLERGKSASMDAVRIQTSAPELYICDKGADRESSLSSHRVSGESNRSFDPDIKEGLKSTMENSMSDITDPANLRSKIPMKILSAYREEAGQESCIDTFCCALPEEIPFSPWVPEHPYLYPLSIDAGEDHVESYFAMRTVGACRDEKGILRFCLNHESVFLNGVLDQGYWPDGLMTAPSDEAFVYDICLAKSLGFNMIRKHIKVEPLRWYYHCDRLGVIVWQDMVNGGSSYNIPLVSYLVTVLPFMGKHVRDNHYRLLSRESREGREEWERECHDTVEHLKNVPSIAVWGLFNEGWGQFDSARITDDIRAQDPTRLIDSASGWFDQGVGDFRSIHNYFRKLKVEKSSNRIFAITEYGGLSCLVKGHASTDSVFGYQKFDLPEEMERRFCELRETVESLISQGLSVAVYTQLSDIEEEVNGLVTYDRKFIKTGRQMQGHDGRKNC